MDQIIPTIISKLLHNGTSDHWAHKLDYITVVEKTIKTYATYTAVNNDIFCFKNFLVNKGWFLQACDN